MGVVVTSTTNSVVFDVTGMGLGFDKVIRRKDHFIKITLFPTYISYITFEGTEFNLSVTGGAGILPVDSIDAVTPTDLNHLFTLIQTILA
jgi:hypothetical protein